MLNFKDIKFKMNCIICGKELTEIRINQNKNTCSKSCAMKSRWKNAEYRRKQQETINSKEYKENMKLKCSIASKLKWQDKEYQKNVSNGMKAKWQNKEYRNKLINIRNSTNFIEKLKTNQSKITKQLWLSNDYRDKIYQTKKKNHTFNTSKPEQFTKELLEQKFDKVLTQYKDERYLFNCDFYIPQFDLFIECNYHWTHYIEPYDENNEKHQKIIKLWKNKNTKFYDNAIETWTKRDVEKLECFKKNNFNYKIFYSYEEFLDWINEF